MNAHLTKPLERDKILQAIVEFASRKRRSPKRGEYDDVFPRLC